ncbi:hypothetical protein [Bradyrhizobium sp. BWA-3-5]|uniref:hypothetical protein n=1 Tax=Bradyrhizobium sp. BWA-3-5 TaxID=3080013 RepID=UPI00293F52B8|nr:hypothetical protein [Bradyrhizobium sp. BWA-3-5]WOH67801.1 hypothetical protein RX331_08695 [Bradyrhizobium sp. BWA-3-5]
MSKYGCRFDKGVLRTKFLFACQSSLGCGYRDDINSRSDPVDRDFSIIVDWRENETERKRVVPVDKEGAQTHIWNMIPVPHHLFMRTRAGRLQTGG